MEEDIPEKNLFMMCPKVNTASFCELPPGYHIRNCRENELDIWKAMPFDEPEMGKQYYDFMSDYFNNVYLEKKDEFFKKCLFVCDVEDKPVGTCFIWKAYDKINTLHWLKILKDYEGKGLGRALLTGVMKNLQKDDYPIYLHTQPSSYRAIKLYADFGFYLLSNPDERNLRPYGARRSVPVIGNRTNDIEECLKILEDYIPEKVYNTLRITTAPLDFLEAVRTSKTDQF
jgi:ribosomal protein S18 acetylase RimI-like enzyme